MNKVEQRAAKDYVSGEVLVKFKDAHRVQVQASRGMFRTTSNTRLTQVLKRYGVEQMEQLLPNEEPARARRAAKTYSGETVREKDLSQLYRIQLDDEHAHETLQLVNSLDSLNEVEFAEPNYKVYLMDAGIADSYVDNPYASQQWYLDAYGVKELWNKPIVNAKRPVIAIIDTGVDMTHPDLVDNLWTNAAEAEGETGYDNDGNGFAGDIHGWDFVNNTPNIRDNNMHGTHVAGIAAAANNGIGIIGANPQALIMPISVMQSDGTGDVATIVKGINYAVQNGATVLNLSLGTYANSRALRQALEKAYQTAVIVAAAGNDGKCVNSDHHPQPCYGAAPMFPAAYSFVLGVQATTSAGDMAGFSNYDDNGNSFSSVSTLQDPEGFNYELKAPGADILSTIPGGSYKRLNGTSMAAPLVAGAISALTMVKDYDTQEILWGDLLHTGNIAEAYEVTARPAELDMLNLQMRNRKELTSESEEDYSGDHEIDAGETVNIYPVVRTTFGEASNIKLRLEMGDEFEDASVVDILTDEVDFGLHLDAYGKGVSLNPLQVKVASDVADNRHIKLKVVATCDESEEKYEWPFTIVVTNMVKISGLISKDTTLTADHVYLVNENLGIMEGATLTIEPGTRLEFMEGMGLSSFGKLVANGTPEKPIVFTGHHGAAWAGVKSHESIGYNWHTSELYTNDTQTLFTFLPTDETPNKFTYLSQSVFYGDNDADPSKAFLLSDYIEKFTNDMTSRQHLLTNPEYLTSAVLQMLSDWEAYWRQFPTEWSEDKRNLGHVYAYLPEWYTYDNPRDTISYCRIDGISSSYSSYYPYMRNCIIMPVNNGASYIFYNLSGKYNNIGDINGFFDAGSINGNLEYSNIINCYIEGYTSAGPSGVLPTYSELHYNNYFNNVYKMIIAGKYNNMPYSIAIDSPLPKIDHSATPSYLGTSREDIIRPYVYEIGNAPDTYGQIDLSNMRTTPITEAHGIVWKVCVNGKDAQDEYEDLAPLGVGKHKFEVYFNRPMNKAVAPQIAFGVREPYTQNAVAEDGSWNEEGTVYTAYKTIDGKTKSDGVNRIYVWGAEDNEYFECPYEKSRFNVMVNAAGSMATGFAGEAQMGRVKLTWDNSENNFDDAMGFNIYRFTAVPDPSEGENTKVDTIRINQDIVDVETTEYTDYDVTPGETYYYMYKVLSTDLQEYDASNVVAVTPLTATRGDANGSGDVDVADVITTVNYAAGMNPKPFIFEAADMNVDTQIDILDVVGIIQQILHPEGVQLGTQNEATATYTIEDGVLYVESPVALAGVQAQVNSNGDTQKGGYAVAADLNGFEHTSAWLSDNDYLFLAYNLNGKSLTAGKHAVLTLGDGTLSSLRLSDAQGRNVAIVAGKGTTAISAMGAKVMTQQGVYNLNGQKVTVTAEDLKQLRKGVYIINGEKVVK